jgi:hypothetical protein
MNLVVGNAAGIAICSFCTHPFHRFVEPDVERNFVAIYSAIFYPTLETQKRRGSEEFITFDLKQESFRIGRSPTIGDLPAPNTGDSCGC